MHHISLSHTCKNLLHVSYKLKLDFMMVEFDLFQVSSQTTVDKLSAHEVRNCLNITGNYRDSIIYKVM